MYVECHSRFFFNTVEKNVRKNAKIREQRTRLIVRGEGYVTVFYKRRGLTNDDGNLTKRIFSEIGRRWKSIKQEEEKWILGTNQTGCIKVNIHHTVYTYDGNDTGGGGGH